MSSHFTQPASEAASPHVQPLLNAPDGDVLALYHAESADAIGLLAYALHRRALAEWAQAYALATGTAPDETALAQFLIGETMPGRIAAYRDEATRMLAAQTPASQAKAASSAKPDPKRFMSWGLHEALAHAQEPLPWRALAKRLLLLLLAVVVTALALRFLVVA